MKPMVSFPTQAKAVHAVRCGIFLSVILLCGACASVGPDYSRPDPKMPDGWHSEMNFGLTPEETDPHTLASWWTTLKDPVLTRLINRAVENNLSLKEAFGRVQEARQRALIAGADLFPTLDAGGSFSHSRSSKNTGGGRSVDIYRAGFDSNWELDVFGGVRRSVEASQADLDSADEALRDVMVSLLAEVALNYINMRSYERRISVTLSTIHALEETLKLTQWRYQAGLTTQLDIEQATYGLKQANAQLPVLQNGLEQSRNHLAVLLGRHPGEPLPDLKASGSIPVTPPEVAVGVPADVLRQRPDIRRAERELAAQTARIGVATADLYPKFFLAGSIGLESLSGGDFLKEASKTYSIMPNITWPIFRAGAIIGNIRVQSAIQEQKLYQYQTAVLTAVEEVENALTSFCQDQIRRQSLTEASQAAKRAVELAQDQYASGLIDFQVVLDTERSQLSIEDQLVQSERDVTADFIALYKALGGGWTPLASLEKNND